MSGYLGCTFDEFQTKQRHTAIYPDSPRIIDTFGNSISLYPFFGLSGEVGEVMEKVKKIMRDNDGIMRDEDRIALCKELGDVLWYISAIAHELQTPLATIANHNIEKLSRRQQNNTLQGSGDNR